MSTEDFETTYDSDNITDFVGIYNSGGIVDNSTGLLGANGGDQLAPASSDLNRQLSGRQACEFVCKYSTGLGYHLGTGFNPLASYLAAPIPEFPAGGNLTRDAIYNTWASFDENAIPPVVDFGQLLLTPEINPLPSSISSHGVAPNSPDGKPACLCGQTFSRPDSRRRHIRTVSRRRPTVASPATLGTPGPAVLFPCMLCDRHRGAASFLRRDHLRQHLGEKGYHKMNKEGIDGYFRTYH